MSRRIALLPSAERDLEGIHEYTVDEWGARQAKRYVRGLRRKLELLAENPKLSPRYRRHASIRVALYEQHRIFYRELSDGIEVGAILHQAQDIARTLMRYVKLRAWVDDHLGDER